jgi:4-carboxymuconolactone decarboxylase
MRVKLFNAVLFALAGAGATMGVQAAVSSLGAAQSQPQSQAASSPTPDQLRQAVAGLRGGRIKRPASYDELTSEQKAFVSSVLSGPRRGLDGSLGVMIASPAFADLMQKTVAYARFAGRDGYSSLTPKLSELAIIMGARAWTAQYAWYVHRRAAVDAGLTVALVEAIRDGRRPARMQPDEEAVYNFCTELLTSRAVSDATFQRARSVLGGDRGVVDLVGTLGAYQVVAMMMVVDQFPLPDGAAPELKPLQ